MYQNELLLVAGLINDGKVPQNFTRGNLLESFRKHSLGCPRIDFYLLNLTVMSMFQQILSQHLCLNSINYVSENLPETMRKFPHSFRKLSSLGLMQNQAPTQSSITEATFTRHCSNLATVVLNTVRRRRLSFSVLHLAPYYIPRIPEYS